MTREDVLWRVWAIFTMLSNTALTILNLYFGGWNLLTVPLSFGVVCLYAYGWGKLW